MIIVEGCDNTGKTTLIKNLTKRFPILEPIKSPGPGPDLARWICKELLVNKHSKVKIYDRFFFSEFVYGPVLRGGVCYKPNEEEFIWEFLKVLKPLTIICHRNLLSTAYETLNEREQMEGVEENYLSLSKKYQEVEIILRDHDLPYFMYNFETDPFEDYIVHLTATQILRRVS